MIIIVGSKKTVEAMVKNDRRTLRYSCLKELISEEINGECISGDE